MIACAGLYMRCFAAAAILLPLAPAGAAPAPPRGLAIQPVCDGAGKLSIVKIGQRSVAWADNAAGRAALKAAIGSPAQALSVGGSLDLPYRCISPLLSALKLMGYDKIGFVAEQPPQDLNDE